MTLNELDLLLILQQGKFLPGETEEWCHPNATADLSLTQDFLELKLLLACTLEEKPWLFCALDE